ncbi:hypothetical protein SEA_LEOPARD_2 [Mycobacterium phage Leopard]|uniref:Uncharacterized protein n=1 Tax=Mycobacterium phage Onyinye TaxID=2686235 RepID=A0A6B9LJA3_9CAUD|nr:hypothetical protein PP339_gp002 [Mycobacterium phage Onyinye]QHB37409.1 hypothetical protein SEA_ONYINYE_2 [Mycobacterium phage Onyinye]UOW92880.1 hypothetical protein SEA_LEOPARD_2 [Mycobacterium phage Leopard]
MIELQKTFRDSYWWSKDESIWLDPNDIQSVEQMTDRTPGGSQSNAYVRIVMRSGVEHKIYGDLHDITRKLGYQS